MNIIKNIFGGIFTGIAFIFAFSMQIWWFLISLGILYFFFKIGWGIIKIIWHFIIGIFG